MADGLVERVGAIYRLDWSVYERIEKDPQAIPQAFAVVVCVSALAGFGDFNPAMIFLRAAVSILQWVVITALIWGVGLWLSDADVDYARVLRCTGFAYAWFALQLGAGVPCFGWLFAWASIAMVLVALFAATRHALDVDPGRAALICGAALGVPLLLLWTIAT